MSTITHTEALAQIMSIVDKLDDVAKEKIVRTLAAFYSGENSNSLRLPADQIQSDDPVQVFNVAPYSERMDQTPKEFLKEKKPQSDVERIACLAYYLVHFRNLPSFKTLDLNKLNTEAAHPKFSNAAYAASNALKMGYLAQATKNQRQISAAGEEFVRNLPDREAARKAIQGALPRRKSNRKKPLQKRVKNNGG